MYHCIWLVLPASCFEGVPASNPCYRHHRNIKLSHKEVRSLPVSLFQVPHECKAPSNFQKQIPLETTALIAPEMEGIIQISHCTIILGFRATIHGIYGHDFLYKKRLEHLLSATL